jgi:Na+/H+ antiporter NhaD/arsenite permease-like protein
MGMLAIISVVVLIIVVCVSCLTERINIGILAATTALVLALGFTSIPLKQVVGFFPSELFFMVLSISLLFGIAGENGTLAWMMNKLLGKLHGSVRLYPPLFFVITFLLSAAGPGNIAATAIIAPIAMRIAAQMKINPFLMAILICTGANAGAFSPLAPTGIINLGLLGKIGLGSGSLSIQIFLAAAVLQSLSALGALILLRSKSDQTILITTQPEIRPLSLVQKQTIVVIVLTVASALFFHIPLMVAALVGSCILALIGASDENSLKSMPWDTILMVCGMSILIGVVEKLGGLDLTTTLLARLGLSSTIHAALAFITGLVSVYSSSSGVVLPAIMPLIPGLLEKVHVGSPASFSIAIAVGSHMVDVSPLSTLGALTIAAYPIASARATLFRKLMTWGLSMSVVGAILAFIALDLLRLWQ